MARALEELRRDMERNPQGVRFVDAVKVATHFFGECRQKGSHQIFKTPWPEDPRVNLQEGKNGQAKSYQIRQLLRAIEKLEGLQRGGGSGV